MARVELGRRRRAVLNATVGHEGQGLQVGFLGRESHRVADLASCLVLSPGLFALVVPLRAALASLVGPRERWGLVMSETENGVDLCLRTRRSPTLGDREALAALADGSDLARVSWQQGEETPEPIVQRREPAVTFGSVSVPPPPGGFLQPSREGEAALAALVMDGLPSTAGRVADLYSGCGTFTFRLADRAAVAAFEGDADALAALEAAARRAGLAGRVTAERRDLARLPLTAEELAPFDCVVFDPPRAGARAQAEQLARSRVPRLVAVSCAPATFARDARILVDGGYRLTSVAPVDQFPWSGHVELVARLER
jgi:23S rRNA (uracil1939-C5)-methyltransferase